MAIQRMKNFVKKEFVLCIAWVLAVISMFIVQPDKTYADYIDYRTLAVMFCLMSVMAGLKKIGLFQWIAQALLLRVHGRRQLIGILVLMCFFFSMLITNDVSLITFVPFTFIVLRLMEEHEREKLLVPIVVMQTVAANLGSMLTPIGNPHNLFLFSSVEFSVGDFVVTMLPYTGVSLLLILIWLFFNSGNNKEKMQISFQEKVDLRANRKELIWYLLLFVLCLLTVVHVIPYGITLGILIIVLLILDRRILGKIDYCLLLTFVGFFIFIGNMGRIPQVSNFLQQIVEGNEVVTSVLTSQIISNVPTAILLSGFTENYHGILVGTNIGGLGTIVASMASLISFKYIVREDGSKKGRYLLYYTSMNYLFLAVLLLLWIVIR